MATSSIFANIVLTTDKEARDLCRAYDDFEKQEKDDKDPVLSDSRGSSSFSHIDRALVRIRSGKK